MTIEEFAELLKNICMDETLEGLLSDIDSAIEINAGELHTEIFKIDSQVNKYKETHDIMEYKTHENILDEIGYLGYFCKTVVLAQDEILTLKELRNKLKDEQKTMIKINTDKYEFLEGKRGLGHKYDEEMKELILKKTEDETIHDYLDRVVINAQNAKRRIK